MLQMADETHPHSWPVLSTLERRLLGVLVEKQKTTPDVYPMSLNALVTGCNQKNNRDPLMSVEDHEVEATLEGLQQKAVVTRVESGRVDKWRHLLYEQWGVGKADIAVLAELLLRGPQTEGELRGRVSRMEPINDLDALRAVCQPLAQRGLVVYLTPEGRRGTSLTHGFHDPHELEVLRSRAGIAEAAAPRSVAAPPAAGRIELLQTEIADLRKSVADLQQQLADIRSKLDSIQATIAPQSPAN
jgi:uncharacterized protein YceH (UPF0502 family)